VLIASPARGDGDPASDVLASQSLFLPQDAHIAPSQQTQLSDLLAAARSRGYPMRVAVIAAAADLGSVTALWRQPQSYARFLGQELALNFRGPLLVVMPNGYGVYESGRTAAAGASGLGQLGPPGARLGAGSIQAVQRLAAAAGHTLPLTAATTATSARSANLLPWIVFALGVVLVAAAWTASLRARPLGRGGHTPSPS
jgi:hypothetical protein